MGIFFTFGEKIKGFEVPVLNEREIRAGAGILFFFAMFSSMNVFLVGNFVPIKIFIVAFLIDFIIRLFINPKFSPSLILGRLFVRNQTPEYVGAPQKRFAWLIGLILVTYMFIVLVLFGIVGSINLIVCLVCLIFLFFESALGICLGCLVYPLFNKKKAVLCAGGVCKPVKKDKIQFISIAQIIIVVLFLALIVFVSISGILANSKIHAYTSNPDETAIFGNSSTATSSSDCVVPQWAIDIGHKDLYKEHHGCLLN